MAPADARLQSPALNCRSVVVVEAQNVAPERARTNAQHAHNGVWSVNLSFATQR
jgi:hypothetical protein